MNKEKWWEAQTNKTPWNQQSKASTEYPNIQKKNEAVDRTHQSLFFLHSREAGQIPDWKAKGTLNQRKVNCGV